MVFYDDSTLYFQTDTADGLSQPGFLQGTHLKVPPVFPETLLSGLGSGWTVAGWCSSCWVWYTSSYSSGESPLRPAWMRRGLYHPSM